MGSKAKPKTNLPEPVKVLLFSQPPEVEERLWRARTEVLEHLATYGLLEKEDSKRVEEILESPSPSFEEEQKREDHLNPPLTSASLSEAPFSAPDPLTTVAVASFKPEPKGEESKATGEKRLWDGSFLKAIRLQRNIPLESIARTIKVSRSQLEALESHRYHMLPPKVYVRGFLRAYARCVGIDPERLVSDYFSRWESERKELP